MISDVVIAGVGMHPFGRHRGLSLKDLARVAGVRAMVDAGIGPDRIDGVYSSNALAGLLTGQEQIRGQTVAREIGIEGIPVVNVENACAGGSTALREAVIAVHAGVSEVVLAIGFEKMFVDDRTTTLGALQSAADLDVVDGLGLQFTAVYAMRLRKRLDEGSLTLDDVVDVAVKSHEFGALNPYAQFRNPLTADEIRASPPISDPLTLYMCSAICDGAAAVVVARRGVLDTVGRPGVAIRASRLLMGRTFTDQFETPVAETTARLAYEDAGVGPDDLDVIEVHDAMAPGELLYYEQLGLCPFGEAGELLRSGATRLGGAHVVNPSGGLTSRGHPVGATGLAQIAELTWQLRGEADRRQVDGARVALAQNSGGWLEGDSAACAIHVLERVNP